MGPWTRMGPMLKPVPRSDSLTIMVSPKQLRASAPGAAVARSDSGQVLRHKSPWRCGVLVLAAGLAFAFCVSDGESETQTRSGKMVFDSITNYKKHAGLSPRIGRALAIAAETDFDKLASGKYSVDGENLFYMVQRYDTAPIVEKVEAHRKYIDIQYMAKGEERLGVASIQGLKVHTPYSEEKDVEFFEAGTGIRYIDAKEGMFVIFWPGDAHMPGRQIGEPKQVTKVVFKIRVD